MVQRLRDENANSLHIPVGILIVLLFGLTRISPERTQAIHIEYIRNTTLNSQLNITGFCTGFELQATAMEKQTQFYQNYRKIMDY